MMMLDIDPSQKKKKGAKYFELDDDLDQAWIQEHQAFLVEEQRQKILTMDCRITLILVSPWSLQRSSTSLSKSFSPRLFVKSSIGLLSPWTRIGNFKKKNGPCDFDFRGVFVLISAFCEGGDFSRRQSI